MTCPPIDSRLWLSMALGVVWAGTALVVFGALVVYADLRTMPRADAW